MKLMKSFILLLFVVVGFAAVAQETTDYKGIDFSQTTVAEAMKEAKETGKLIFIDAYTSWCGPCKLMAKNSFPDATVGELYNANFINLKVEMEKDAEGPELSKKYNVQAYPTLLIIDHTGRIIKKVIGYQQPADLIKFGQAAIEQVKL